MDPSVLSSSPSPSPSSGSSSSAAGAGVGVGGVPRSTSDQDELQRSIFSKSGDEILALFGVAYQEREKPNPRRFYLVLTLNTQLKTSRDRFGAPKLHWIKIKGPSQFSYKKMKLLSTITKIECSKDGRDNELTLTFMDQKRYVFIPLPLTIAPASSQRNVFVWWLIECARLYLQFIPPTNLDQVVLNMIAKEVTSVILPEMASAGSSSSTTPAYKANSAQRNLVSLVARGRATMTGDAAGGVNDTAGEERMLVPAMTDEEVQNVNYFLKQSELDIANIHQLEGRLMAQLAADENANMRALFEEETMSRTMAIIGRMDEALERLDEMSLWMTHHDAELARMRMGIERIESRNQKLEIQEHNHEKLYETLRGTLDTLELKRDVEDTLKHPNFGSDLRGALAAAKQLDQVIRHRLENGLEEMQAVKDHRKMYEVLRSKFCAEAAKFLEALFADVAKKAEKDYSNERSTELSISSNDSVHRKLREYQELATYLERLEPHIFHGLRQKYTQFFARLYESKIRSFFLLLRKCLMNDKNSIHDLRLATFPDTALDGSVVTGSVRRQTRHSNDEVSVSGSHESTTRATSASIHGERLYKLSTAGGKLPMTLAFRDTLEWIIFPLGQSEERFLATFFLIDVGTAAPSTVSSTTVSSSPPDFSSPSSAPASTHPSPSIPSKQLDGTSSKTGTLKSALDLNASRDEMKKLMYALFRGLEEELKELITFAEKYDHFNALDMLVTCEKLMDTCQSEFLSSVLTTLQVHLKILFNEFIESEIAWITSQKPSAKRSGILTPFSRFPSFVDRVEEVVRGGRSQAADTTYQKVTFAMMRWLDTIAKQDDKYQDLVIMENCHYFATILGGTAVTGTTQGTGMRIRHRHVPALEEAIIKADQRYREAQARYVQWSIEYELPAVTKFWAKLEDQLRISSPEDIPFAQELSKQELRVITREKLNSKAFQKCVINMHKRLQKHMPKNIILVRQVWQLISQTLLDKMAHFEKLVQECYQNEKLSMTLEEVAATLEKLNFETQ